MEHMGELAMQSKIGHQIINELLLDDFDYSAFYSLLSQRLNIGQLLDEFGIEKISESGSNIAANCPYHDDRTVSWGINCDPDSEKWGYHGCFSCHAKGNIATLARDFIGMLKSYREAIIWLLCRCGLVASSEEELLDMVIETKIIKERKRDERKIVGSPTWIKSLELVKPGTVAWEYFRNRRVTFAQIVQSGARIGVGKTYGGRAILPIINHEGKLVSFYARDITGKQKTKGLYPKGAGSLQSVLYGRHLSDLMDPIAYLVEGIFDIWAVQRSLQRVGKQSTNVFAALKSSLSDGQADLLKPFDCIIVVPDMQGRSEGLVPSVCDKLEDKEILIVEPNRGHDPDSLPDERLDQIILHPESVYKSKVKVFVSYAFPITS